MGAYFSFAGIFFYYLQKVSVDVQGRVRILSSLLRARKRNKVDLDTLAGDFLDLYTERCRTLWPGGGIGKP